VFERGAIKSAVVCGVGTILGQGVTQGRDFIYITAHFIEQELDALASMIRSRHWHRSAAWPVVLARALGIAPCAGSRADPAGGTRIASE
jgi:hypothetical protein